MAQAISSAGAAPFRVLNAFAFPKLCRCCKTLHTAEAWSGLLYVGLQTWDPPVTSTKADVAPSAFADEELAPLELRNCTCGSTLGIEVMP